MVDFEFKDKYDIDDLVRIVGILRSPGGCPWDIEQSHKSIRQDFIEEVYEAIEAIDNEDSELLREELGDVLLQVVFHCRIEEENKKLESTVKERTKELEAEKNRSENLLLNILPKEIAKELTAHPDKTIANEYPNVTVLFTDIVGFTKISGEMTAEEVVTMLNKMFSMFDERAQREGIEKIKTIGDAYMAATGLTLERDNNGAAKMIRFAQGLLDDVRTFNKSSEIKLQIRLGINSGSLVAGVIGKTKFIYDIWGDTVNVASRMESTGLPMQIHVTETTKNQTSALFQYSQNTEIDVKGKGMMKTYFL